MVEGKWNGGGLGGVNTCLFMYDWVSISMYCHIFQEEDSEEDQKSNEHTQQQRIWRQIGSNCL